jgi:hypothetical protein
MRNSSLHLAALALLATLAAPVWAELPKPAKPAKAAAKPAPKKPAAAPAPVAPELADANEEQLAAFDRAHLGEYACEFKQTVQLTPHTSKPGYINVAWGKQLFTMKPVLSHTGALRLEDVTGRTLMIQIANKSMLLDVKIGQRIVDDCIHPEQTRAMAAAKAAAAANPDGVAPSGLGISK